MRIAPPRLGGQRVALQATPPFSQSTRRSYRVKIGSDFWICWTEVLVADNGFAGPSEGCTLHGCDRSSLKPSINICLIKLRSAASMFCYIKGCFWLLEGEERKELVQLPP